MKFGVESQKLMKPCSNTFKIISLVLFIVAGTTSSQNLTRCPFRFFYQFGDGVTDIGNSIRVLPEGPLLPAARPPYGETFPRTPTGRWSDGLIDADYAAAGFGLRNIISYLELLKNPANYDGVVFSVAYSPVLDHCARVTDSIILFGDIEANDIAHALVQGKSIEEAPTYIPCVTEAQINAGRELIGMGATRLLFSGNAPLGCYPYILTKLASTDPSAYDEQGCLRSVNDLIVSKNSHLQQAVTGLKAEFPTVTISYANDYDAVRTVINQTSAAGPGGDVALRACCGIGGRYNYDSLRYCGSPLVPVCPNPDKYVYWDGQHFTQEAYQRIVQILLGPALPLLNCTTQ